ncbi:hypothetical protein R69919_05457 [Paraburkholderia gardini]|nr:hypothetical protein R69919_05457 [Paraburkholderia gardini]
MLFPLQTHREELQARYPAVGQFVHVPRVALADLAQLGLEERFGLGGREAQVAHVQFQHETLVARAAERERHRAARNEHEMKVGRRVVEQPLQCFVITRTGHVMQVVQHQYDVVRVAGNAAYKGDDRALDRLVIHAATAQQRGFMAHRGIDLSEACDEVVEKVRELVVFRHERQPRDVESE